MGWDVENYARSGSSNELTFRFVMKYLAMGQPVDRIIVQWTELKRYSRLDRKIGKVFWSADELSHRGWQVKRLRKHESHPDFGPEQEMILIWTRCIQQECLQRGIKCNFVAYCDLSKIPLSPLWDVVDTSLFLHSTFDHGWKNHCLHTFQEDAIIHPPENPENATLGELAAPGHLTDLAVDYTTDCWYNYLTIGKQISIETINWVELNRAQSEIYRYDNH